MIFLICIKKLLKIKNSLIFQYKKNKTKFKKMERVERISIITLGDTEVGKTSIIKRIYDGSFQEIMFTTANHYNDFFVKRKYTKKNITIDLRFRDTAGQERFQKSLSPNYIRNSNIVLLVFCDVETLNTVRERWYNFYKENANIEKSRFILVANKSDIFGEEKEEINRQGEVFAEEINAHFITCSAKSRDNIDTLEEIIVNEAKGLIDSRENSRNQRRQIQSNNQNVNLNERKNEKKDNICC